MRRAWAKHHRPEHEHLAVSGQHVDLARTDSVGGELSHYSIDRDTLLGIETGFQTTELVLALTSLAVKLLPLLREKSEDLFC